MNTVLLSSDLMLVAAAQGATDRRGVALSTAANEEAALVLFDHATALVLIDLRSPGLDVARFVPRVRTRASVQAKIVACGPHVHQQSLAAAAAAGCDEVITRGEFDRRIDAILETLTAPAAADPVKPQ